MATGSMVFIVALGVVDWLGAAGVGLVGGGLVGEVDLLALGVVVRAVGRVVIMVALFGRVFVVVETGKGFEAGFGFVVVVVTGAAVAVGGFVTRCVVVGLMLVEVLVESPS